MTEMFAAWSNTLMYAATGVYALAMLAHAGEWAFHRERRTSQSPVLAGVVAAPVGSEPVAGGVDYDGSASAPRPSDHRPILFGRVGVTLTVLATLLLGAGVLARGLAAERVPWSNLYEFTTTGTFLICVAYLMTMRRYRLAWLGLPVTGLALVLVVVAMIVLYTPVAGLIPPLRSYWLAIHVTAAVTASAVFTVGALTSMLQILRARAEQAAAASAGGVRGYLGRLPTAEAIETICYRLHAFAFPVWTFALITGAIWAAEAWGRYWGWDPKEVWMFITWVGYAAYLHARATGGWRTKAPWVALLAYGALLFNLVGVNLFLAGLHSYA